MLGVIQYSLAQMQTSGALNKLSPLELSFHLLGLISWKRAIELLSLEPYGMFEAHCGTRSLLVNLTEVISVVNPNVCSPFDLSGMC